MKKSIAVLAALILIGCESLILLGDLAGKSFSSARRAFEFHYAAVVKDLPLNTNTLKLWLPIPINDEHQSVSDLKIDSRYPYRIGTDPVSGNSMVYLDVEKPKTASVEVQISCRVDRKEYRRPLTDGSAGKLSASSESPASLQKFLKPDRLVPIDGKIRDLALEVTARKTTALAKARAIYDYVTSTLRYDKTGTGWGRGDALYACDAKHGNCTDFHSLFIGMARTVGIPAKFEIGFPIPEDQESGEIPGYHCWAEFYVQGIGWIPIDSSEASKNKAKVNYFFGALDVNRVQYTVGRDLALVPPQAGSPLNYFVYPYAEVNGKEFKKIGQRFSFEELR